MQTEVFLFQANFKLINATTIPFCLSDQIKNLCYVKTLYQKCGSVKRFIHPKIHYSASQRIYYSLGIIPMEYQSSGLRNGPYALR